MKTHRPGHQLHSDYAVTVGVCNEAWRSSPWMWIAQQYRGSDNKEFTCNAGDLGSIPGWGRFPGGGHGNPLQYSCLENPMNRGAWQATVHGLAKSWT